MTLERDQTKDLYQATVWTSHSITSEVIAGYCQRDDIEQ
jgi:hypothetical protein